MDPDKLNTIVEDLALSEFINDTKKSIKLFNKLKYAEKILKNNYKLDT